MFGREWSVRMTDRSRLRCKVLSDRVMSAEDAAAFITSTRAR
jgi:hypothetical protein